MKRASVNSGIKVKIHNKIKDFKKLAAAKDFDNAAKLLSTISSMVDKAAKKGTIHWKNAARKKARLSAFYRKAVSLKTAN